MGTLNSLKIFFVPALAPSFFNIAMIASMLILPSFLEREGKHRIYSLGIGVLLGGLIQLLVQLPLLLKKNFGPLGPLSFINIHTKKIAHRLGVGTIGIAATQINILITTLLASGTQIGAISWLAYAFRLFQFPVGILSVSIAGSNLVHFSEAWKSGEQDEAKKFLNSSYLLSLFTIIPALALFFALAQESVHLVFERGAFDFSDTLKTTHALRYYLIGLPFYGLYKIFSPTFFVLDRPQTPIFISIFSIGLNIIFCLIFVPRFGFHILALGTSLSMMVNCTLQIIFIYKILKLNVSFFFSWTVVKIFLAGGVCWGVSFLLAQNYFYQEDPFYHKGMVFCLIGVFGAISYLGTLILTGEKEYLLRFLKKH